jgi:hypothetical protein
VWHRVVRVYVAIVCCGATVEHVVYVRGRYQLLPLILLASKGQHLGELGEVEQPVTVRIEQVEQIVYRPVILSHKVHTIEATVRSQ